MTDIIVTHTHPAWRSRANFIIATQIDESHWEQLWTRRLADERYQLCCIPFFPYDLALGDIVTVAAKEKRRYVLDQVVATSGHYTFRAWFGSSEAPGARKEVQDYLVQMQCAFEWRFSDLVAIDAVDHPIAQTIADYLHQQQALKHLEYETGLTHDRLDGSARNADKKLF